jgi:predicted amidophosphoribosyltransferase
VLEGESGEPTAPEPRIGARKAVAAIADVLVPPLCLSCHERLSTHDALCPACWSGIDFIRALLCDHLGLPMPYDTGGRMVSGAAAAKPPEPVRAP